MQRTRRLNKTRASTADAALTDRSAVSSAESGDQEFGSVGPAGTALPQLTQRSGHDFGALSVHEPDAKFTVSRPGDRDELEADRVAEEVVGRRPKEPEEISRRATLERDASGISSTGQAADPASRQSPSVGDTGAPLESATLDYMEPRFGHDFSQVRVHTSDAASRSAEAAQAQAYTTGSDIVFRSGKYVPGTKEGDRLLAHELTHVIQQEQTNDLTSSTIPAGGAHHSSQALANQSPETGVAVSSSPTAPGRVQRQAADPTAASVPGPSPAPVPAPTPQTASGEWSSKRAELESIRARATVRQLSGEAYAGMAEKVIDVVKTRLTNASAVYGAAYKNYERVIAAGKAAARREEEFIEIGVGILMAVTLGVGVEAGAGLLIEEAAEATLARKLAEAAVKEAITAGGSELGKAGAKSKGWLEVVGTDLEPGGLKPEVLKLKLWMELTKLHEEALHVVRMTEMQSLIASGAEYAIGEVKAQMGGGASADMPVESLNDLIGTLASSDAASTKLDVALPAALAALQTVHANVLAAPEPSSRQQEIEQDIWILWIAELSESEADVLDIDAIEDYLHGRIGVLGSGSRLGVDFGWWTSKADELDAIHAAAAQKEKIEADYQALAGGGTAK